MLSVYREIFSLNRCCAHYFNDTIPFKINVVQSECIEIIMNKPGISQDKIAQITCMDKSTVARQIAMLEENELVIRRSSKSDRRMLQLYATRKAVDMMPQIHSIIAQCLDFLTQDLTNTEKEQLQQMLKKLQKRGMEMEAYRDG